MAISTERDPSGRTGGPRPTPPPSSRTRHRPGDAVARGWYRRAAVVAAAALAWGCNEEIVVRIATQVFPDGTVARRIDVAGRDKNGEAPTQPDWLEAEAGLLLAEPTRWKRVDTAPGRIAAEGVFPSVTDMPACLRFVARDPLPGAIDRCPARLTVDDLVVLKRYRYEERWTDPLGGETAKMALDRLTDLAVEALRGELVRQFGADFDPSGAERFLRGEARNLLEEELVVSRRFARQPERARREAWSAALRRRGIKAVAHDGEKYWQSQAPVVLAWLRARAADAVSTPQRRVTPEELTFWPEGDALDDSTRDIARRTWGDESAVEREIEGLILSLQGWHAASGSQYRFFSRVTLPGRLLTTSGTVEDRAGHVGGEAAFFFRGEDMAAGELVFRAESVTLEDEALRSLGARREFDAAHLLEIADLLAERDPAGLLRGALRRAVDRKRLDDLRGNDALPDAVRRLARELADQLDPVVGPPFG